MKFHELPVEMISIRVASTDGTPLARCLAGRPSVDVVQVLPNATENVFDLAMQDSILAVAPTRPADGMRLNRELSCGRAQLVLTIVPIRRKMIVVSVSGVS
jgi:hypothetical protein